MQKNFQTVLYDFFNWKYCVGIYWIWGHEQSFKSSQSSSAISGTYSSWNFAHDFHHISNWISASSTAKKKYYIIKHNELVKYNRKVVESLVDIVIYLANQKLPFRGHAEDKNSENRGNYVELVSLLGKCDVILGRHLQVVMNEIKNEISNSLFVAIIFGWN